MLPPNSATRLFGAAAVLLVFTAFSPWSIGTADAATPTWIKLNPANSPSTRYAFAMAYDPVSQKVVLFGGTTPTSYLNDTWTFDGTTWTQASTLVAPPARSATMLAYDAPSQKLVLFGGFDGSLLGDTWLWDGATSTWTQANPTTSPAPRSGVSLFTDPKNQHADVFSGFDGKVWPGDVWQWNGTDWAQLQPPVNPEGRAQGIVGYDLATRSVVVTGGINGGFLRTDNTWTWNGNNWRQQFPATQRPYVFYTAGAYDPLLQEVVSYGGDEVNGVVHTTWGWTGTDWVQLQTKNSPPTRDQMGIAYDPVTRQLIMFGGLGLQNVLNDTWKLVQH